MQQRLCLAHALVHDPQVLLLDEPASGLDPRARVELRELLRELRTLGKTILISSHILPELEELCTQRRHHRPRPGARRRPGRRHRAAAARRAPCCRVRVLGRGRRRSRRARPGSRPIPRSRRRALLDDGQIELGFRGDDDGTRPAARGGRRRPASGSSASRARRATSRSCSCRSRRSTTCRPREVGVVSAAVETRRRPATGSASGRSSRVTGGHRRGRRQGAARPDARTARLRRADRLPRSCWAAFAWMVELFLERQFAQSFGGFTYASAEIGRGVFAALLLLRDAAGRPAGAGLHRWRDQPGAREADPRPADGDADQLAGHRRRQAASRP